MPKTSDFQPYQRASVLPTLMCCPLEWITRQGSQEIDRHVIEVLSSALRVECDKLNTGDRSYSIHRHEGLSRALSAELSFFEETHLSRRYGDLTAAA